MNKTAYNWKINNPNKELLTRFYCKEIDNEFLIEFMLEFSQYLSYYLEQRKELEKFYGEEKYPPLSKDDIVDMFIDMFNNNIRGEGIRDGQPLDRPRPQLGDLVKAAGTNIKEVSDKVPSFQPYSIPKQIGAMMMDKYVEMVKEEQRKINEGIPVEEVKTPLPTCIEDIKDPHKGSWNGFHIND